MTEPRRPRTRLFVATATLALLALVVAGFAWNVTSLRGLPDIGDPFDVAAFTSTRVSDEDNAFVLYRRADALYRDWDGSPTSHWASASAGERKWLDENREALAVWKQGTERPDACFIPPAELTFDANLGVIQRFRTMVRLALLEASRLEAEGDFKGAWSWYRGPSGEPALRAPRLPDRAAHRHRLPRATWPRRSPDGPIRRRSMRSFFGKPWRRSRRSTRWRRRCPSLSSANISRSSRRWSSPKSSGNTWSRRPTARMRRLATSGPFRRWRSCAQSVLKHDPERSRRLLRLIAANWLAYCDRPAGERPPLEPDSRLVYRADSSAAPVARLLSPEQTNSWYDSTIFLRSLFPASKQRARQSTASAHAQPRSSSRSRASCISASTASRPTRPCIDRPVPQGVTAGGHPRAVGLAGAGRIPTPRNPRASPDPAGSRRPYERPRTAAISDRLNPPSAARLAR